MGKAGERSFSPGYLLQATQINKQRGKLRTEADCLPLSNRKQQTADTQREKTGTEEHI